MKVLFLAALVSLNFIGFKVFAGSQANLENGIILKGYDPVSYFLGSPKKGKAEFKLVDKDITYLFANAENLQEFKKTPQKYAPAYEGWCATGVLKNKKIDIDPLDYKITDGRLFLFYHEDGLFGGDAKPEWVKGEPANIKKADGNWPKVKELKD